MRIAYALVVTAALAASTLFAQDAPEKPRATPKAAEAPKAARAPEAKPTPEPPRLPLPSVNVRIDVRIIDERGGQPSITKPVSLTVADRSRDGSIRSSVRVPMGNAGIDVMPLNVDVSPVVEGSRIRLGLVVEYTSAADTSDPKQFPRLEVKQRLSLVLEDGKPVRAAQSADPVGDHRVSLEVTATILR
jgi:hypothetical protein